MCGTLAKFHGHILSLSENITKSFRGATFLTHTVGVSTKNDHLFLYRHCQLETLIFKTFSQGET